MLLNLDAITEAFRSPDEEYDDVRSNYFHAGDCMFLPRPTDLRLTLMAILVTAPAACATSRLETDVKPYVGRKIDELTVRFGKPHGQLETTGSHVFVWSSDTEGSQPTSLSDGVSSHPMTREFHCTLEVTVDEMNIIQSFRIDGSNAGCHSLRRQLDR